MKEPESEKEFYDIMVTNGMPDIVLIAFPHQYYYRLQNIFNQLKRNVKLLISVYIELRDLGYILYKALPATQPLFTYFLCFEWKVWLLLMLTLISVAIFLSLLECNYKNVLTNVWNVFTSLITKSISKDIKLNKITKPLIGCWLLLVMFVSILFTSFLLDYMIKAIPEDISGFVARLVSHVKYTDNVCICKSIPHLHQY